MSITRHYCTYFDQRYLPRALALYHSLKRHGGSFRLWALCFDDFSYQRLIDLKLQELHPISHEEFTRGDDQLLATRKNRTLIEYYFTCSPSLPLYVLNNYPKIDQITYLDADLYFFNSPELVFAEIGSASVAIIPHRFPSALRYLETMGIYNVGWLTFKRDMEGISCLQRWRNQCLEWCYDRIEGTRYADQGYLNDWPETYRNLTIIQQKGANLAPWSVSGYRLSFREDCIWVDDDPLIFYHFQSLSCLQHGIYNPNLYNKARIPWLIKTKIYAPYIKMLEEISREEKTAAIPDNARYPIAETKSMFILGILWLKNQLSTLKRIIQGGYIFPWDYR
jgi:hypothetical protein